MDTPEHTPPGPRISAFSAGPVLVLARPHLSFAESSGNDGPTAQPQ